MVSHVYPTFRSGLFPLCTKFLYAWRNCSYPSRNCFEIRAVKQSVCVHRGGCDCSLRSEKIFLFGLLLLFCTKSVREIFGHGLIFLQTTSSKSLELSSDIVSLSTALHHQMAPVGHVCKKMLRHYHVQWSKCMDKSRKAECDRGQRRTAWFLWKEGVTPSDIRRRLPAVCVQEAPSHSTVLSRVRNVSNGKEIA
jgi:hypothetical protein